MEFMDQKLIKDLIGMMHCQEALSLVFAGHVSFNYGSLKILSLLIKEPITQ